MGSEQPPDVHVKLNRLGIEQLIKFYESEVDHNGIIVERYQELLGIGSAMPRPWVLRTTRITSAAALRVATATHRISEVAIMMRRLREPKDKQFASHEESAKWDRLLRSLNHHLRQKYALLVQLESLCCRYGVIFIDHLRNPREINEPEQATNEAGKREVVDLRCRFWQQEARTRSTELWIEVKSHGKDDVSDPFATLTSV